MPGFALFGGSKGSGTDRGYGDLTDRELGLLNEADQALLGEDFESPVHIDAFPDEGAIYVNDGPCDGQDSTSFHYGDWDQADRDLLTVLNSSWNG